MATLNLEREVTVKYVPSALIGQLSRSLGSTTASHNRYGAYLRGRIVPVNPNTPAQQAQRDAMLDFSQSWRNLTAAQRAGWAALGAAMSKTDSLGQPYSLTGLQAYTSVNRNLRFTGQTELTAAPALAIPIAITSITPTATSV